MSNVLLGQPIDLGQASEWPSPGSAAFQEMADQWVESWQTLCNNLLELYEIQGDLQSLRRKEWGVREARTLAIANTTVREIEGALERLGGKLLGAGYQLDTVNCVAWKVS